MKVTSIKAQVKRAGRYSVFVDSKYSFSLSADALLGSKLIVGQILDEQQVGELKKISDHDKLYAMVLNYLAIRPRSKWEIETYLRRKLATPSLSDSILSKLSNIGLVDDSKFAESFVRDRRLLRSSSRRKLITELRQKKVPDSVIQSSIGDEPELEINSLTQMIQRKRKQSRYSDDLKLMQYLSRQGFNYGDIKDALKIDHETD